MIEVKNLYKSFDGIKVLKGISTVFEAGKTNLIIGQSGSGKTVLLKCLLGLFDYEEGSIDSVNFDGCIYHKITDVILEEDSEKLVFREIYTSGTPTVPNYICDGGEVTVTFQTLGENAISMIMDYGEDFDSETFTLIKSSSTFSSNSCSNALSSGYLLF